MPAHLHKMEHNIMLEVMAMHKHTGPIQKTGGPYTAERRYFGTRTAEEVVIALLKTHR